MYVWQARLSSYCYGYALFHMICTVRVACTLSTVLLSSHTLFYTVHTDVCYLFHCSSFSIVWYMAKKIWRMSQRTAVRHHCSRPALGALRLTPEVRVHGHLRQVLKQVARQVADGLRTHAQECHKKYSSVNWLRSNKSCALHTCLQNKELELR